MFDICCTVILMCIVRFTNVNHSSSSLQAQSQSSLSDAPPRVRRRSSSSKFDNGWLPESAAVHSGGRPQRSRWLSGPPSVALLVHELSSKNDEHRWTLICKEKDNIPTDQKLPQLSAFASWRTKTRRNSKCRFGPHPLKPPTFAPPAGCFE